MNPNVWFFGIIHYIIKPPITNFCDVKNSISLKVKTTQCYTRPKCVILCCNFQTTSNGHLIRSYNFQEKTISRFFQRRTPRLKIVGKIYPAFSDPEFYLCCEMYVYVRVGE
jgi:hypothetical protein